jgi:hypothetical protein
MKPPKDFAELFSRTHDGAYKNKWEARLGLIINLEKASARLDPQKHKEKLRLVREGVARLSYELVRDAVMADEREVIYELGRFLFTHKIRRQFNVPAHRFGRYVCMFHHRWDRYPDRKELEREIIENGDAMSDSVFEKARLECGLEKIIMAKAGRPKNIRHK